MKTIFTSESVTKGHPDKICDQVSDAILDAIIAQDPHAHVACETVASKNILIITGEISTNANIDVEKIARETVKEIGYTRKEWGFKYDEIDVEIRLSKQSSDINQGVCLNDEEIGAGDQGMMFGYACDETDNYMPLSFELASKLAKKLDEVRENKTLDYLGPDGKSQVSIEYENGKINRIDTIVVSNQHLDSVDIETVRKDIKKYVIDETIDQSLIDENTKILINPTGRFVIGGPIGDVGLTGRKIIVDTYGGYAPHGGGAFSGKDPSKVDRSAAYYARYIAKHLVAAKLCDKVMIQASYAIGVPSPVSVYVECYGTNHTAMENIYAAINDCFDLSVKNLIDELGLRRPIYKNLASYGHMGREDLNSPFEKLDKLEKVKTYLK